MQQQQKQEKLQQQQQQWGSSQRTAGSTLSDRQLARYSVALQPGNLEQSNNSELMVNLNVQMNNALADHNHVAVIKLFDQLLDKGIQAAQEQQQQQQQQQQQAEQGEQQQKQQQQQQQALLLPQQFRPDYHAVNAYCRAVVR
jgi:hypothetical protein